MPDQWHIAIYVLVYIEYVHLCICKCTPRYLYTLLGPSLNQKETLDLI